MTDPWKKVMKTFLQPSQDICQHNINQNLIVK